MRKEAERRLDTMRISWEAERIELDGRLAQLQVGARENRTWREGWHSYGLEVCKEDRTGEKAGTATGRR